MDYGSERIVQNALVTMYSKLARVEDASVVFERIGEKDLTSWGSMIAGFAQQGFELEALLLLTWIYIPNEVFLVLAVVFLTWNMASRLMVSVRSLVWQAMRLLGVH